MPEMLRILIGTAIAFGVFFTISELVAYRRTGRLEDLVIAIVATAITVAMGYYLKNLKRFVG
ncbi:MAG: hypothetical protein ACRELA_16710 [Candidatus Rokuibacteriota bacterium]